MDLDDEKWDNTKFETNRRQSFDPSEKIGEKSIDGSSNVKLSPKNSEIEQLSLNSKVMKTDLSKLFEDKLS